MPIQQGGEGLHACVIAIGSEEIGLCLRRARRLQRIVVEGALVIEEVRTLTQGHAQGGEGSRELIANREREGEPPAIRLLMKAARTRLLEQDAHRAIEIGISRALAWIVVVIRLASEIDRADGIQGLRMLTRQRLGQFLVLRRRERMHHLRNAGLEEVTRCRAAHLVVVGDDVRLPLVPQLQSPLRLRHHRRQIVAIQIEPVIVRASARPAFQVLRVRLVRAGHLTTMIVGP